MAFLPGGRFLDSKAAGGHHSGFALSPIRAMHGDHGIVRAVETSNEEADFTCASHTLVLEAGTGCPVRLGKRSGEAIVRKPLF